MADNPAQQQTNYQQPQTGKVIKGTAKIEKPPLNKRIINFLFSDRMDSIASYLSSNVLGPTLKKLIFDMGTGALQMALFGGVNPNNSGNYIPGYGYSAVRRDPVPYNQMSAPPPGYAQPNVGMYPQTVSINEISFDTKDDAYLILDRMQNDLRRYGKVRVADFYSAAGISGQEGNWTLQGYGWYSLEGAMPIMRTDMRWMISFPPMQMLH